TVERIHVGKKYGDIPRGIFVRNWVLSSLPIAAANLVLHQTVERIHVGKKYGDIPRGIFVVRGENVVLLGEIAWGVCLSVCCPIRSLSCCGG
uniref:Sm domain-containing protein n=1 Tax=Bubo bubo TaxID=30461 RepID=A0A8C0I8B0_BUBBB